MIKKIYSLLLLASLAFYSSSCSDQLDIKSEASLSANAPLATEDIDKLLNGLYIVVTNPNSYGYFNVMYSEIMSDNLKPVKFQWIQVKYLYDHVVPSDDILLGYNYQDYYKAIFRANTIIKSPSSSEAQIASAKYCRAYTYLRLYDLYESVPLVDENYDNTPIAPSSKDMVLDFIVNDLIAAKNASPIVAVNQAIPSAEAAQALLARVYRMQGNITQAAVEAESLIESGKFSLSADPTQKGRSSEVIMRFASVKDVDNAHWGWIVSPLANTWNNFAAADDIVDLISDTDTRRALYEIDNKDDNGGFVYTNKYKTDGDADLLVSRIAEMYLISAEAGNTNRMTEFQASRKSSLTLTQERRLELAFEWVRWSDMKLEGETFKLPYPQQAVDANSLLTND